MDINDNELTYLELIHLFVEVLDQYFGNVCELDIVFNFHKVHFIQLLQNFLFELQIIFEILINFVIFSFICI